MNLSGIVYEPLIVGGIVGLVILLSKPCSGFKKKYSFVLLFVMIFMIGWRCALPSRITSKRYSELFIAPFALLSAIGCVYSKKMISCVCKNQTKRYKIILNSLPLFLFSIILFSELFKLFRFDAYKGDIVQLYMHCQKINQSIDQITFYSNNNNEKDRIIYYSSQDKTGVIYPIHFDNLSIISELTPDYLFRKNLFFISENKNGEHIPIELPLFFKKNGSYRKIASLFTSSKKNKIVSLFQLTPIYSTHTNPRYVQGRNKKIFLAPDLNIRKMAKITDIFPLTIKGARSSITPKELFPVPKSNRIDLSVEIKNIGNNKAKVYVGYIYYNHTKETIGPEYYPERNQNCILKVISAQKGELSFFVDKMPPWQKKCRVVLGAKNDMSDVPNGNFLDGDIVSVEQVNNNYVKITMSNELKEDIPQGSSIRIQGVPGAFIYKEIKVLSPGESFFHKSSITQYDYYSTYSRKAISRGVYYIRPVILSYSFENGEANTIEIHDWTLIY